MTVSVLGIGPVSALGSGVETLRSALRGELKAQPAQELFQTTHCEINVDIFRARVEGLERFVPKRALRRVDPFARMALLSSHLAVEDSGLEINDRSRLGIVFASAHGSAQTTFNFLDGIIDDGDAGASPTHFANSVHNALASQVSIIMKASGPCSTITGSGHSVGQALFTAQHWLESGDVDYVLAGFGDEYCPVLGYAVACFEEESGAACTYRPGEGHISFLLGRPEASTAYGQLKVDLLKEAAELKNTANICFVADNGSRPEHKALASVMAATQVTNHHHLTGSLPLAAPFEMAFAMLAAQASGHTVSCLEHAGNGLFNHYRLSPQGAAE